MQAEESKRAQLEEWLNQLRIEVEDSVDKVEEYLERRAEAPLSVIGILPLIMRTTLMRKLVPPTSKLCDVPQASEAAEALREEIAAVTREVAALKVKREKKRLQEELKLQ